MKIILGGGAVLLACLLVSGTAFAYALGTTPPAGTVTSTISGYVQQAQQAMGDTSPLPEAPSWFSDTINSIMQWFEDVTAQGAQSTGVLNLPPGITGPFAGATSVAQNLFGQFDAWLYGIIHFHIAIVFNFFFGLVGWVLSLARDAVDWLNSVFQSAAGR
jgi:hypothetical protein